MRRWDECSKALPMLLFIGRGRGRNGVETKKVSRHGGVKSGIEGARMEGKGRDGCGRTRRI